MAHKQGTMNRARMLEHRIQHLAKNEANIQISNTSQYWQVCLHNGCLPYIYEKQKNP